MQVVAKKDLYLAGQPTVKAGRMFDCPEKWAKRWLREGAVELYQTKVVRSLPLEIAGQEEQSSVSPVVQVSPKKTLNKSGVGGTGKRRSRAKS